MDIWMPSTGLSWQKTLPGYLVLVRGGFQQLGTSDKYLAVSVPRTFSCDIAHSLTISVPSRTTAGSLFLIEAPS